MSVNQSQIFATVATPLADQARVVRFVIATVVDRHGTVLDPMGLDLDWFQANPVAIWSHAGTTEDMPAPRPEDLLGRVVAIERDPNQLTFDLEFAPAELNPMADRVYRMVVAGYLRAVSLGFGIFETQDREGVKVITRSELHEISLCIVGSNPSALAVRSYITNGRKAPDMDKEALVKLLGLDETADRESAERACMAYLVKTEDDPEQRAAVVKALDESFPESDGGEDETRAAEDEGSDKKDETRAAEGEEGGDKKKDAAEGDKETRALRAANAYLVAKLKEAQAGTKTAVAKTETRAVAIRKVDGLVRSGRVPASMRDRAVKDELAGILDEALKYVPEGANTVALGAQRSGAGARVQARSAPPAAKAENEAEAEVDPKEIDAAAARILKGSAERNRSTFVQRS